MLAPLIEPYASDATLLLALCVWREARGEGQAAKRGVVDVITNRCKMAPREGFHATIAGNVLKPWAFSSFMDGDPNSVKYPRFNDPSWYECQSAAADIEADSTGGAVFYFSKPLTQPPAAWGPVTHTATIGGLQFYRKA